MPQEEVLQVPEEVEEGVMEVLDSEGHESFDGSDVSGW